MIFTKNIKPFDKILFLHYNKFKLLCIGTCLEPVRHSFLISSGRFLGTLQYGECKRIRFKTVHFKTDAA